MTKRLFLALALLAACGSKAAADAATDAAGDVAAADEVMADTGADVAVQLSPAAQMCADIAAQVCITAIACCQAGTSADCVANETAACLKVGFAGIDDASAAGVVKLDAARGKACHAALNAAATGCDYLGVQAARRQCLLAWLDCASKGDTCTATAPIACDSFGGRCDPVTTDSYACRKTGADGDGCNLGKPCSIDLDCLNTKVTRATVCGKPNSTCELSDACAQGFKCSSGFVCGPWDGGAKDGTTCDADNKCAVGFKCAASKCTASFCGL